MSKELEYIEDRIKDLEFKIANPTEYKLTPTIKVKIDDGAVYQEELETLKNIKQALLELQAIKEAKPSEALERLDKIDKTFRYVDFDDEGCAFIEPQKMLNDCDEEFESIKATLLKAEKLEKAWEVVKEHLAFEYRGTETYANQTKYLVKIESKDTGATIHIHLDTQDEVELLKEMIG